MPDASKGPTPMEVIYHLTIRAVLPADEAALLDKEGQKRRVYDNFRRVLTGQTNAEIEDVLEHTNQLRLGLTGVTMTDRLEIDGHHYGF